MNITFRESSVGFLPKYIELYRACFPKALHLKSDYLTWLYSKSPDGAAVGADALHGEEVIGQVLAVPGSYWLRGELVKGLLAVNVAVHPAFQGRQLFKNLGLMMCEYGASRGYGFVIGVANAAATPGWTRQMGFQLISPLEARIGVGGLGIARYDDIVSAAEMRRAWRSDTLQWRAANPMNPIRFRANPARQLLGAYARSGNLGISAFAELPNDVDLTSSLKASMPMPLLPRVFLGLIPGRSMGTNYFRIPERFKPSPLNLIYKNLDNSKDKLDPNACFINFLDFDAF